MAISANTVWEVRTTGNDTLNSGGFVAGASGTDYSQQDAAQYTASDLTTSNGATNPSVVSSASHTFTAADVGNLLRIRGGSVSWTTGWYEIVSVAGGNATLDRAAGTVPSISSGQYSVGGAMATVGLFAGSASAGNDIWVKSGTYLIISTSLNVTGGRWGTAGVPTIDNPNTIRGYYQTRWNPVIGPTSDDLANPPVHQASGISSTTMFSMSRSQSIMVNMVIDCNNLASMIGVVTSNSGVSLRYVTVKNATIQGFGTSTGSDVPYYFCYALNCTTGFTSTGNCFGCSAKNCTTGFSLASGLLQYCVAWNCGDGFGFTSNTLRSASAINCVSYGHTATAGFKLTGTNGTYLVNCVSYSPSVSTDYSADAVKDAVFLQNCAGRVAGTGYSTTNFPYVFDYQTISADPFTNSSGGDFTLSSNATALRGAGWPKKITPNYISGMTDIGVFQHQVAGESAFGRVGILGQISPSATTLTAIFVVPTGYVAALSSIMVCNTNSTSVTFRISIQVANAADATKQYIYYNCPVAANDTYVATVGITMAASDEMNVYASAANVAFTVFGTFE